MALQTTEHPLRPPQIESQIMEDEEEVRTPYWIPPPSHPLPDPDPPYPEWILLHGQAFLDHLTNATTTAASTKDGHRIHVTFWSAAPPSLSYFTVHCPGLERGKFSRMPAIVTTDGSLALLRVSICPMILSDEFEFNEYFIYDAKESPSPSLKPIRNPSCRSVFPDHRVGLMRRSDGGFFVAVLSKTQPYQCLPGKYHLYLYDSTTGEWEMKIMDVDSPEAASTFSFASKVINIGGRSGSMGWVDLWKGILIYDLFVGNNNNNVLRYIPLPPPPPWVHRGLLGGCPISVRDIVAVNGSINYFEMYAHLSDGWIARTSTWKMDSCNNNWQDGLNWKASELRMDNPLHLNLLHGLQGDEVEDHSPLLNLHAGHPTLSLHHDGDVVYILLRALCMDEKGCLLVIDMRNKAVREVVDCCARTSSFTDVYRQSRISKHLYRDKPTPAKRTFHRVAQAIKQTSRARHPWLMDANTARENM